ncbi:MAG: hypothetical protein FWC83_00260 [Alphaproteobacteria bacterium]|nr:hypothetical protein [Alphaproteobacteria bacterium]
MKLIIKINSLTDLYNKYKGMPVIMDRRNQSAQRLVDDLKKIGIIFTKFSADYGLSKGDRELLHSMAEMLWVVDNPNIAINKIELFSNKKVEISDDVISELLTQESRVQKQAMDLINKIITKNPSLATIPLEGTGEQIDFLKSVLHGYSPENIAFYIKNKNNKEFNDKYRKFRQEILDLTEVSIGSTVLTDKQREKLLEAAQKYHQHKIDMKRIGSVQQKPEAPQSFEELVAIYGFQKAKIMFGQQQKEEGAKSDLLPAGFLGAQGEHLRRYGDNSK